MAGPVLSAECLDGAATVYRMVGGATPEIVGGAFGSALGAPTNPNRFRAYNRVVQTLRADALESYTLGSPGSDLYMLLYDGIYRYNRGPAAFPSTAVADTWSADAADGGVTFANPVVAADAAFCTGLHPAQIGDRPHLIGVRRIDSGNPDIVGFTLNLVSGVFTQGAAVDSSAPANTDAADASGGGCLAEIMHNGVLHYVSAGASAATNVSFRTYNPTTDTHGVANWPGIAEADKFSAVDLFVFRGRLFAVYALTADGVPRLMEYAAGSWSNVLTLQQGTEVAPIDAGLEQAQWMLGTPNGTELYAFCLVEAVAAGGDYGWKCYEIDSAVTAVVDRTTTVLPTALRTTADGGAGLAGNTGRMVAFHDTDETPGSITLNVYHADDSVAATPWMLYEFQIGPLAEMQQVDVGGSVDYSMPKGTLSSGERVWTPNELDILITNRVGVIGGEVITFRAAGDAGSADKSAEFAGTTLTNPLTTAVPLTGTATGGSALRVGNAVTQVDADGVTDYTVTVDVSAIPAVAGDRLPLAPRVFI